jgi:hypothetical protein
MRETLLVEELRIRNYLKGLFVTFVVLTASIQLGSRLLLNEIKVAGLTT